MKENRCGGLIFGTQWLAIAMLMVIAGCGQGVKKYKVTGQVFVNGEPAGGMMIRFLSSNETLSGQDKQPVAVSGPDGRFELSSFGGNDGAVDGDYVVTFFWPTNILTMTTDRMQGLHVDPKTSKHTVTIPPKDTELEPFRLEIPKQKLLPSEFSSADLERGKVPPGM
jgi:hypothetical protein